MQPRVLLLACPSHETSLRVIFTPNEEDTIMLKFAIYMVLLSASSAALTFPFGDARAKSASEK